jgi:DNA ligase (NAD+)
MNIDGLGGAIVDVLLERGMIRDAADIYALAERRVELEELDRFGKKSVENLLNAIENSKNNPPERLLFGLGIRLVGSRVAQLIMRRYKSINALFEAPAGDLSQIPEIGEKIAGSLRAFFDDPQTKIFINKLETAGVRTESETEPGLTADSADITRESPLAGLTFVVTGVLPGVGRRDIERQIEFLGGKTSSSVSRKTGYVLAGEDAGSKLAKAIELGIPVIGYDEYKRIAGI